MNKLVEKKLVSNAELDELVGGIVFIEDSLLADIVGGTSCPSTGSKKKTGSKGSKKKTGSKAR